MTIGIDTHSIFPNMEQNARDASKRVREINEVGSGGASGKESVEDKPKFEVTFASMQRDLTAEEQRRVEFLKNLLIQTLTMAQGDPSDAQKKQIREAEDELEKLTGVKMRTRISNITDKMPGKDEDEDEDKIKEKEKQLQQAQGIDPKKAIHNSVPVEGQTLSPGMQMLRNNALATSLKTLDFGSAKDLLSL
ncbi:MAG: hypothetical protein OCC46_08870 [Pseudodesulfovibrio sp.]